MENAFNIIEATLEDIPEMADLFFSHITAHKEYISHGELQMGIAHLVPAEEKTAPSVAQIAPDAREKWMAYLQWHLEHPEFAFVGKVLMEDGKIGGFTVAEIQEDGDIPFGVICDILVREDLRGRGIGSFLLDKALEWLRQKDLSGIYLESGLHNHSAHEYFKRRGFRQVSEIYRLEE